MGREQGDHGASEDSGSYHTRKRDRSDHSRSPQDDRGRDYYHSRRHDNSMDHRSMSPADDFYKRRYFDLLQENDILRDENRMMRKELAKNRHKSRRPQEGRRSRSPDSSHRRDTGLRMRLLQDMAIDTTAMTLDSHVTQKKRRSVGSPKKQLKKLYFNGYRRPFPPPPSQQETRQAVQNAPKLNQSLPQPTGVATTASTKRPGVRYLENWLDSQTDDL